MLLYSASVILVTLWFVNSLRLICSNAQPRIPVNIKTLHTFASYEAILGSAQPQHACFQSQRILHTMDHRKVCLQMHTILAILQSCCTLIPWYAQSLVIRCGMQNNINMQTFEGFYLQLVCLYFTKNVTMCKFALLSRQYANYGVTSTKCDVHIMLLKN